MDVNNIGIDEMPEAAQDDLQTHFDHGGSQPNGDGYWCAETDEGEEFFFATNGGGAQSVWCWAENLDDDELGAAVGRAVAVLNGTEDEDEEVEQDA